MASNHCHYVRLLSSLAIPEPIDLLSESDMVRGSVQFRMVLSNVMIVTAEFTARAGYMQPSVTLNTDKLVSVFINSKIAQPKENSACMYKMCTCRHYMYKMFTHGYLHAWAHEGYLFR